MSAWGEAYGRYRLANAIATARYSDWTDAVEAAAGKPAGSAERVRLKLINRQCSALVDAANLALDQLLTTPTETPAGVAQKERIIAEETEVPE